jgi:uncharacterized RDD family membrane protein YckC
MSPGDDYVTGIVDAAGRAAMRPARAAAGMWRDQLEGVLEALLTSPEAARAIDRALAGPLPEEVARSIVRHRVLDRLVAELEKAGELDDTLQRAVRSKRTGAMVERLLATPVLRESVARIASSPEVRGALTEQTVDLSGEILADVRTAADRVDARADRRRRPAPGAFAGLATRAFAMGVDLLLASALYLSVVGAAALLALMVGGLRPEWLVGLLLSIGWSVVGGAYFVLFWSTSGRTPGMRLLGLRVRTAAGGPPSVGRSLVRLVGLALSVIPMFLGFVPALFDARRRALDDMLAGTVVVRDEPPGP